MADRSNRPCPSDVLVRMVSHALVAGVAAPLGVPGSALGAAGVVLFDAAADADRRVWAQFSDMVDEATAAAGVTPSELAEWAASSDQHLALVRELVSAALATLDADKIRALRCVLTDALVDEAMLDESPLIIRALRELDPVHVRVLHSMVYDDNPEDPTVTGMKGGRCSTSTGGRSKPSTDSTPRSGFC